MARSVVSRTKTLTLQDYCLLNNFHSMNIYFISHVIHYFLSTGQFSSTYVNTIKYILPYWKGDSTFCVNYCVFSAPFHFRTSQNNCLCTLSNLTFIFFSAFQDISPLLHSHCCVTITSGQIQWLPPCFPLDFSRTQGSRPSFLNIFLYLFSETYILLFFFLLQ